MKSGRISHLWRRLYNAARKIRAGLTLFGENTSPEVPNDLFVAHLSVYLFASQFCAGKRVLDLGSGAGYGSAYLLQRGATAVVGIDIDRRNVRYAGRKYPSPSLTFIHGDAERLDEALGSFGLIVASNVLEHLHDVKPAFASLRRMLDPEDISSLQCRRSSTKHHFARTRRSLITDRIS